MIPNSIWKFAQRIDNFYGGNAYLVGGWVRDHVLGVENKDYDIEVHGVPIETLKDFIGRYYENDIVGESFKVWKVYMVDDEKNRIAVDVSVPRTEKKVGVGHKAFEVTGDPFLSIEEACRRRDFMINAMLYHILDNKIIDPYGGQEDIRNGIIRVVDPETFVEDSLRVLRAMQFAARFNFGVSSETVKLCRTINLSDLPSERIWGEVEKWLLSKYPTSGFYVGKSLGVFEKLFSMLDISDSESLYIAGNAIKFINSQNISKPEKLAANLCVLSSLTHSVVDFEKLLDILGVYTYDGYNIRNKTLDIVAHANVMPFSHCEIRHAATKYDVGLYCLFKMAENLTEKNLQHFCALESTYESALELGCLHTSVPALLKGRHLLELGVPAGKRVGEICKFVYELQLDGKVNTLEEAIAAAKNFI